MISNEMKSVGVLQQYWNRKWDTRETIAVKGF